ncbi:MAG TPA: hypothetical protein VFJ52_08305, partial [Terriglobia bacterium]|nr:hypothetical protein [Terriglobia bacterium]
SGTIKLLQSNHFKWPFQVQYIESLETRDEAIQYAGRHGCNLIVQYSRRTGPMFDVLQDPEQVCTSIAEAEVIEISSDELMQAQSTGRSRSALASVADLIKRFSAASRRPASNGRSSLQ